MRLYLTSASCGIVAAIGLICVAGCGEPKPGEVTALFYPPAPDPPRLQFLLSFSDASEWVKPHSTFADFILGRKRAVQGEIKTPYGVAARNGKIYICDLAARCVHVIDIPNKTYSMLGKRGRLDKPVNITIDADGTKYVCDTVMRKVAVFDTQDQFVRYLGDPTRCNPIDLAIYGDELFVADVTGGEVEAWSREGKFLRLIARKGVGPGELRMPTNLEVGPRGRIFVSDTVASIVNVYNRQGKYVGSFGAPGDRPGFFARPKGIAIDPNGILFSADAQWEIVQIFDAEGRLLMFFGGAGPKPEGMGMPAGLAIDYTSIPVFASYVDKDFKPEYLLLVANQFGQHKIGVYAFGKSKTATYAPTTRRTATRPSTTRQGKARPLKQRTTSQPAS